MTITAQTADGVTHEFPDGTPDAVVDKVIQGYVAQNAPAAPPAAPAPSTYSDILKSAATGLGKGVAAVAGIPGDVGSLEKQGIQYIGNKISPGAGDKAKAGLDAVSILPTSSQINTGIQDVAGQYHTPETTAGKYAETIASFAPAALGGEGSLLVRGARTIIPAVASETAGEFAQGTPLEGAARVGGALAGAVAGNPAAMGAIRSINAAAVGRGLPPLLDPAETAATKMRVAVNSDGGPNAVGSNIVDWQGSGASSPTLIDVGGNNVRRLVRAAASGGNGQAQNVATDYAGRVRSNFQDAVIDHTNALTPGNTSSVSDYADQLEQNQRNVANETYGGPNGPYAQPATVTHDMVDALQGPEGRGAINRAYTAARANRDVQQMGELSDLRDVATRQAAGPDPITGQFRSLGDALTGLSSGSLDRVRIAMRDIGANLAQSGARDTARGYAGRVADIDTALDQTPGLQPARAVYSQMQGSRDALDVGGGVLSTPANEYSSSIADLAARGGPPNIGSPLQVGARQALVNKLETGADGATGAAKTISQASRATQNLGQTFGTDRAATYQAALGNEVKRVGNADFISPNTGSQTALRGDDGGLLAAVPTSKVEFLGKVIDTLRGRGATLTDAERTAIVRMGTTPADLRLLARRNPQMRSAAIAQIAAGNSQQQN